ncbi:MAG: hypothetical protein ACXAD7_07815, partial [Candidatus Kariarchaeaceae archaeon]
NNESIDPFKLGRLASNSLNEYYLDYSNISRALETDNNPFMLEVINPLNVSIDIVTNNNPVIQINGSTTLSGRSISESEIKVFVVEQDSDINEVNTISDTDGLFSVNISPSDVFGSNGYSIVCIAKYGHNAQDVAYTTFLPLGGSIPSSKVSLFESSAGSGNTINVTASKNTDTAIVTSLFFGSSGQNNFSSANLQQNPFNYWTNNTLPVPETGLSVILVHETQGNALQYSTMINFPVSLDNEISGPIKPTNIPSISSTTITISVQVRGLLMDLRFTIWS